MVLEESQIYEALKAVVDPEIQMNIVDIGLVYNIDIHENNDMLIQMTLTSPGCPFGPEIVRNTNEAASGVEGAGEVEIEVVWDPPWGPERMSEEARMIFGY